MGDFSTFLRTQNWTPYQAAQAVAAVAAAKIAAANAAADARPAVRAVAGLDVPADAARRVLEHAKRVVRPPVQVNVAALLVPGFAQIRVTEDFAMAVARGRASQLVEAPA